MQTTLKHTRDTSKTIEKPGIFTLFLTLMGVDRVIIPEMGYSQKIKVLDPLKFKLFLSMWIHR